MEYTEEECGECHGNGDFIVYADRTEICTHCGGKGREPVAPADEEEAEERALYSYARSLYSHYR